MEHIIQAGKELGLAGADLQKFLETQQALERDERKQKRDEEAEIRRQKDEELRQMNH